VGSWLISTSPRCCLGTARENRVRALINLRQSNEERQLKYHLCRRLGSNSSFSKRMRDWRWNKIARRYGYSNFTELKEALEDDKKT